MHLKCIKATPFRFQSIVLTALFLLIPAASAQFTWVANNDSVTITGISSSLSSVVIPNSISGIPVTEIGTNAFKNAKLSDLTIPGSVITICSGAFSFCTNLTTINFSSGLRSIGAQAFYSCRQLTNFTLPDGLQVIGDEAFVNTGSNTLVVFPATLQSLGNRAFARSGIQNAVLTDTALRSLGAAAFQDCWNLTNATLPRGLERVSEHAFSGTPLQSVQIPEGVVNLEKESFESCFIRSVTFPTTLTNIEWAAFNNCINLGELHLPSSLLNIDGYAFSQCDALTNLTISEGLSQIEFYAFAGSSLSRVDLPSSLKYVSPTAFACLNLTNINIAAENSIYKTVDGVLFHVARNELVKFPPAKAPTYSIPDGTIGIGESAFGGSILAGLHLPPSLVRISTNAFAGCSRLASIDVPDSVLEIGPGAFWNCFNLLNVKLSASLTVINEGLFRNCSSLTEIILPEGITLIGVDAFESCGQLKQIQLPSSVKDIQWGAFWYCTNLTQVRLPDKLTRLDAYVFNGCYNLESVTFPKHLASIGEPAFPSCTALKSLYFPGDAPLLDNPTSLLFFGPRAKVYHLPDAKGWGPYLGGAETIVWDTSFKTDSELHLIDNGFTFSIQTSREVSAVLEASNNFKDWFPLSTNLVSIGSQTFTDVLTGIFPQRFYRIRSE